MSDIKTCDTCRTPYVGPVCPACAAGEDSSRATVMDVQPDTVFAGLEVVGLIGRGGMGLVYKARQPSLNRWVALKVLPPMKASAPGFSERFEREAQTLAALSHPNIVGVHDFGQAQGMHYLVMEYVDGRSLAGMLDGKALPREEALRIAIEICKGLEYAHGEGVIHRDIKPANILVDDKGRVKIADFGLAKLVEGTQTIGLTQSGMGLGTPHYTAPEQMRGAERSDQRADVFSLGVVLYEMLTGILPVGRFDPPTSAGNTDQALDRIVFRTLERNPDARYPSIRELREELEKLVHVPAAPQATSPQARKGLPVGAAVVGAAVLVILGAGSAFLLLLQGSKDKPPPRKEEESRPTPPSGPFARFRTLEKEGPLKRSLSTANAILAANPFLAQDDRSLDMILRYLASFGIWRFPAGGIRRGYVAQWGSCSLIALETRIGAQIKSLVEKTSGVPSRWGWHDAETAVIVVGKNRDERALFLGLVRRTEAILRVSPTPLIIPIESLAYDPKDLPQGWILLRKHGTFGTLPMPYTAKDADACRRFVQEVRLPVAVSPKDITAAYGAMLAPSSPAPAIRVMIFQFRDDGVAKRYAVRLAALSPTGRTGLKILRGSNTVAMFWGRRVPREARIRCMMILERRMGLRQ